MFTMDILVVICVSWKGLIFSKMEFLHNRVLCGFKAKEISIPLTCHFSTVLELISLARFLLLSFSELFK